MAEKIFFKEGKAKGVCMEDENDIPQIIGITKTQFFALLIAAVMIGGGMFGLGYILGIFKNHEINKNSKNVANTSSNSSVLGTVATVGGAVIANTTMQQIGKLQINSPMISLGICYIIMGSFKSEKDAKDLIEILKKIGKTGNIKIINGSYVVFLGPYTSESLAQNELESIKLSEISLNGSIVSVL